MDPVESFSDEPISGLGTLPLLSVTPQQTVLDAIQAMRSGKRGFVLVCDGGRPLGVLSERDILKRIGTQLPLDVPVTSIMTSQVWSVLETDSLGTALHAMAKHHCRHLVVVSESGEARGVLSVKRIVRSLVEHFPASVYNLPPVAGRVPKSPEGA